MGEEIFVLVYYTPVTQVYVFLVSFVQLNVRHDKTSDRIDGKYII